MQAPASSAVAGSHKLTHALERISARIEQTNFALEFRDLRLKSSLLTLGRPSELLPHALHLGLGILYFLLYLLCGLGQSLELGNIVIGRG